MDNSPTGYAGARSTNDDTSELNAISFVINQILNSRSTVALVLIKGVTNSGGVSKVGFVDVRPMVNQLDGARNAVPHGIVYHIPYFRMQGGTDAVIMDPKIGDIGLAVFADEDISAVKASGQISNPGSLRTASKSDGLYFGGFLNGVPEQYVQFSAGGINVVSPSKVTITAPSAEVDATTSFVVNSPSIVLNGAISQGEGSFAGAAHFKNGITSDLDIVAGEVSLINHLTSGVKEGTDESGKPIPG